jgi:DNA-binding MarR family transcriptional regulator
MFKGKNLALSEFFTLKILNSSQDLEIKKISELLTINKVNITQILDSLEEKNYIKRLNGIKDRRKKIIVLTEEGKIAYQELNDLYLKTLSNIFSKIEEKDIKTTNEFLQDFNSKFFYLN